MALVRQRKQPPEQKSVGLPNIDQPNETFNKFLASVDREFKTEFLNIFQECLRDFNRISPQEIETEESESEETNKTENREKSFRRARTSRQSDELRRKRRIRRRLQGSLSRNYRDIYKNRNEEETTDYIVTEPEEEEVVTRTYHDKTRHGLSESDRVKGGLKRSRPSGMSSSRRRARSPSPYLGRGRFRRDNDTESEESEDEYLKEHYDTTRRGGPSQADRAKGGFHSGEARRRRKLLEAYRNRFY